MKDLFSILSILRERIGAPDIGKVGNRKLLEYLTPALDVIAAELEIPIVTAVGVWTLTAGTYQYPLPPNCWQILWVEWNSTRLEPASIYGWIRDNVNWRTAANSTPASWAVENRELIVYPPPSAAAVTTDSTVDVSYLSGPQISEGGVAGFTDLELHCACVLAAIDYLGNHPTEENLARKQNNQEQYQARLGKAIKFRRKISVTNHGALSVWSPRLTRR